jgi:hypothetical protein
LVSYAFVRILFRDFNRLRCVSSPSANESRSDTGRKAPDLA